MNIRYFESMVDHHWKEMQKDFPAIEKPILVPAKTLRGAAPMYMRRYIDQDESSFYMFIKADPLKGDASREMACRFFDDFIYNKMNGASSYEGQLDRVQAVDKEVLPARDDREYQQYYDEQMKKATSKDPEAERQARIEKLGFDPDDGETIDIDDEGNIIDPSVSKPAASSTAVGAAQTTAVGMPKPIWFAVDLHIPAGGNTLGYAGGGRLGGGRGRRTLLRNSEGCCEDDQLTQEEIEFNESIMAKFRNYFN